jgi:uncharacterized protein
MASDVRVVIDTGVLVSAALLPRSVPRQAFDRAVSRGTLLISEFTLGELEDVLRRPKFSRYVSEEHRLELLEALVRESELVEITASISDCRDPRDNKFLELGVSGSASHIVTGDADLLALHPSRGIRIITPKDFLIDEG